MPLFSDLTRLFFPRICAGCGTDISAAEEVLCIRCGQRLPATGFHLLPDNPVEKIFWGRVDVAHATACFYFSKGALLQALVHQFKYKGRKDIALFLGRKMAFLLQDSPFFRDTEVIVPVPLFAAKEKRRGYNQSALLAEGMAGVLRLPLVKNALRRQRPGDTQTHKSRPGRWENVQDIFAPGSPEAVAGKRVLLVDDVLTTGATLEACSRALLQAPGTTVSIAVLAFAGG